MSKKLKLKLEGSINFPGHTNRIFSLKFSKSDPNMLASGGWDKSVIIWDLAGTIVSINNSDGAKSEVHWTFYLRRQLGYIREHINYWVMERRKPT